MTRLKKGKVKLPRSIRRLFPQVKSAYDSASPIEVSVNKRDCDEAKRLNPAECALAKAARRELKADGAVIGISSSYVIKGDKAIRFATPESVRREIVSFDRHQDFARGTYHLPPKSPAVRFGAGRVRRKTEGGGKDKNAKRKIHHSVRIRVLEKG